MGAGQSQVSGVAGAAGSAGGDIAIVQANPVVLNEDPKLQPGYFGVTVGGLQASIRPVIVEEEKGLDPALLQRIKSSYNRGFDDGIAAADNIAKSVTEGQRQQLRDMLATVNENHLESSKKTVSLVVICLVYNSIVPAHLG
jgi:hypothetical protein